MFSESDGPGRRRCANAVPVACFAATSPGSMASIFTSGGPARRGSRGVRRRGWSRCRGRRGTATARTTGKSGPPAPVLPSSRAGGRQEAAAGERSAGWLGWLSGGELELLALGLEVGDQPVDQVVAVLRDGQVHALDVQHLQVVDLCGGGVGEVHRHLSIGGAFGWMPGGRRPSTTIEQDDRSVSAR